jgi:hypothetical protein
MHDNLNRVFDSAMAYTQKGYRVFPVRAGEKRPETANGFHDATTDPGQIEAWFGNNPQLNIGIPTGGMLVVDIDPEGLNWLDDEAEKRSSLTDAPWARTPRGGHHFWFKQPEGMELRNSVSRLAPGVDTRATGGYVVVAPSCVGDCHYTWLEGHELPPIDQLPEPPLWLLDSLEALDQPSTGRELVELDQGQIPEGRRNHTLFSRACAMRRTGWEESEIEAALQEANRQRCNPPLPEWEVRQIAQSVCRYEPNQIAVAIAEGRFVEFTNYEEEEEQAEPDNPDPGPVPLELLNVPGFINDVAVFTMQTAPYPNHELAFMGALCLQALLAGRKVRDNANNRTSIFALALANSGTGKDAPRQANSQILQAIGLGNYLGDSFASGEGIEDRLYLAPNAIFQTDEVDTLLNRLNSARDPRFESMMATLLKLYTSAGGSYPMRVRANQEPTSIVNPNLVLFGTAIPRHFYAALNERLLTNGFFARLLILETGRRGQGQEVESRPVPEAILEVARYWAQLLAENQDEDGNEVPLVPILVPHTQRALQLVTSYRIEADEEYTQAENAGDEAGMALWARANEKARRLALIYACSENPRNPRITEEAVNWANSFVSHLTKRMLFQTRYHAQEGKFAEQCQALVATLRKWRQNKGDAWMPFWQISRKHAWPDREHDQVRTSLIDQRLIDYQEHQTSGRPTRQYRLREGV